MNFSLDIIPKINHSDIPAVDSYSILFQNGCYMQNHPPHQFPEGMIVGSFATMCLQYASLCHDFFSKYNFSNDLSSILNATHEGDGFFLFVPAGIKLSKPIQITNLFDEHSDVPLQTRNLVMMEAGSAIDLFIGDYTLSDESCISNEVMTVAMGKEAYLEMVCLQKMNSVTRLDTHTTVQQAASSRMKTHYITMGGNTVHNSLKVTLSGQNAEHATTGLSLTQQNEHVDNDVLIVHASPNCQSNQLFKNILSDKSTGVFTGRIIVNRDAQKTTAYQRSSNILLHPKAKMNIRPQLEIYADDVKCSHGATVGQLDAEALFYLRSRGIDESEAKKMLLHAFAREIVDGISCTSLRESITILNDGILTY